MLVALRSYCSSDFAKTSPRVRRPEAGSRLPGIHPSRDRPPCPGPSIRSPASLGQVADQWGGGLGGGSLTSTWSGFEGRGRGESRRSPLVFPSWEDNRGAAQPWISRDEFLVEYDELDWMGLGLGGGLVVKKQSACVGRFRSESVTLAALPEHGGRGSGIYVTGTAHGPSRLRRGGATKPKGGGPAPQGGDPNILCKQGEGGVQE